MEYPPCDLLLDEGNTRTKLGLYVQGKAVRTGTMRNGNIPALDGFLQGRRPSAVAMASVATPDEDLMAHLRVLAPLLLLEGTTEAPVKLRYGTPATLGADRLANAAGAHRVFPGRTVLVIDPGTCITYDLVEADGSYTGGAISPGMQMRSRAMNAYSARLPLVEPGEAPPLLGGSTLASLASGVHHGVVGEMEHYIGQLGRVRPGMAVVLTGGDAMRFANALKSGIFAHPLLTLEGLYAILDHHRAHLGFPSAGAPTGGQRPGTTG
jgi:type III pantothenate kinase